MKFKALAPIVFFLSLQVSVHSQINYEGSFDEKEHSFLLDNGELKYANYDKTENAIILYHSDHSHWKSVPLNLTRNVYFDELKSISENVFNEDALIELAYTCVEYQSSNELEATTTYVKELSTLYVINEEGSLLLEVKNGSEMEIVNSDGELKLWVYKQAGKNNKEHIDVYSLPNDHNASLNNNKPNMVPVKYGVLGYRGEN